MATIYIVTAGSYSDYGICAVFTEKSEAKAWMANPLTQEQYKRDDPPRIEEWETGPPEEFMQTIFRTGLYLDSGNLMEPRVNFRQACVKGFSQGHRCGSRRRYVTGDSVESAEHSMKIAVEERQKWLAEIAEGFTQ